jgi:hypothetical protein
MMGWEMAPAGMAVEGVVVSTGARMGMRVEG